jgi:hypothetical protein
METVLMIGGKAEALKTKALQRISRYIAGKSPSYMPVNKVGGNAPTVGAHPEKRETVFGQCV